MDSYSLLAAYSKGIEIHRQKNAGTRTPVSAGVVPVYASGLKMKCGRQAWYEHHNPHLASPHETATLNKFMLGDAVEVIIATILEEAGLNVHNKQHRISVEDFT